MCLYTVLSCICTKNGVLKLSKYALSPPFFFFNDTATTEIYTLSLHDALPISTACSTGPTSCRAGSASAWPSRGRSSRSEEHTSELQSPCNLVCRLLLEKKKKFRVHQRSYSLCVVQHDSMCEHRHRRLRRRLKR